MTPFDVAILVGSLRADSFNRKIVDALAPLAKGLSSRMVDYHDLPMMNEDIEATPLNAQVVDQPEVYVPHAAALVGPNGRIADARTLGFLQTVAEAFRAWIERQRSARAA